MFTFIYLYSNLFIYLNYPQSLFSSNFKKALHCFLTFNLFASKYLLVLGLSRYYSAHVLMWYMSVYMRVCVLSCLRHRHDCNSFSNLCTQTTRTSASFLKLSLRDAYVGAANSKSQVHSIVHGRPYIILPQINHFKLLLTTTL